jgi:hypothetical protein
VALQRGSIGGINQHEARVSRRYRRQVVGKLQQRRLRALIAATAIGSLPESGSPAKRSSVCIRAGLQRIGQADLHIVGSRGESERPAGVAEGQSVDEARLAIDQNIDRQAGIEIVGNVAARNACTM